MAIDYPEEFEELRRRIELLEAMLSAIIDADGYDLREFLKYGRSRDDDYFGKFFSKRSRRPQMPEDFRRLIDRYYYRREEAFREILFRIDHSDERQDNTNKRISSAVNDIGEAASQLRGDVDRLDSLININSSEMHRWLSLQSLGLDLAEINITRYVPMRVYISEVPEGGVESVSAAINQFIENFGFEISDDFPGEDGSWFKKWFVKTKDVVSQPEVKERLGKIERALELKGLGLPQAEIDAKQMGAISELNKSLENIPSAAFQVGSLLYVKIQIDGQSTVMARTLTQSEMIVLENNQGLLSSPATCMSKLAKLCRKHTANNEGKSDGIGSQATEGMLDVVYKRKADDNARQLPYIPGDPSDHESDPLD